VPYLKPTSPLDPPAKYAALWHCWGIHPLLTTNTLTLSSHSFRPPGGSDIPLSSLPPSFRDPIHITRALGLRYLWIDSLCIIQDSISDADWERESPLMGEIYSLSSITIAASASPVGEGGCSIPRPATSVSSLPMVKCLFRDEIGMLRMGTVGSRPLAKGIGELSAEPLSLRAWVLQERLLSPRTLLFVLDRVLFECHTHRLAESGVPVDASEVQKEIWDGRLKESYPSQQRAGTTRGGLVWDWHAVVEGLFEEAVDEVGRQTSALSGLASVMEVRTGER
jgi:hypothetical protein